MAEKLCGLQKKGGNAVNPLVIFVRGGSYSQFILNNDLVKKYKYIKVMTGTEYTNYVSPSVPALPVSSYATSITVYLNHNGSTVGSSITLTTTPVTVSTLGLDDGKMCFFEALGSDAMYPLELYN